MSDCLLQQQGKAPPPEALLHGYGVMMEVAQLITLTPILRFAFSRIYSPVGQLWMPILGVMCESRHEAADQRRLIRSEILRTSTVITRYLGSIVLQRRKDGTKTTKVNHTVWSRPLLEMRELPLVCLEGPASLPLEVLMEGKLP